MMAGEIWKLIPLISLRCCKLSKLAGESLLSWVMSGFLTMDSVMKSSYMFKGLL